MRVMVGLKGDIYEGIQLGSDAQEAAIEALWTDPEHNRSLAAACEAEGAELVERVRRLGSLGSDVEFDTNL